MRPSRLVLKSLAYYWRANAAVVIGTATAVSVLAGALLVGDSVRGSLRDLVLQRLGRTDRVVLSSGFFREDLAQDLRADEAFGASFRAICPLISVAGFASDAATGRRASRVMVYGVDDRFWSFHDVPRIHGPDARDALLSRALASEIGAVHGGAVLVRVELPSAIPIESLHGRKENAGRTLRLTVRAVVGAEDVGDFSLLPQQGSVRAVFVPLKRLQQDLNVQGRVNALIVADRAGQNRPGDALAELVRRRAALDDVGLTLRVVSPSRSAIALESPAAFLDEPRATVADAAARDLGLEPQPVLTYLVNSMRSADRQVPYSLVASVTTTELRSLAPRGDLGGSSASPPIVLNDWAARDLGVKADDTLTLEYYVWEEPGRLLTRAAVFRVAAVVTISGLGADRDLVPIYPGISDAENLRDWDPPFPIDLRRIRPVDEEYWRAYRTTPKAFVPLDVGQRLWRSRYGDRTSTRITPPAGQSPEEARDRYAARLRAYVDPLTMGFSVQNVRADGLAASHGATDFGEYFTYFSFFLVVAALALAALFFRLGVEQRAREVGLLRSVGFSTARVRRLFLAEGLGLALLGAALGVVGAVAYGYVMMTGLRTWWSGAVGTTALRLHVSSTSLAVGAAGALAAAIVCIWFTLAGLARLTERSLLAGNLAGDDLTVTSGTARISRSARRSLTAALGFGFLCVLLTVASLSGVMDRTGAFFGAGLSLLIAGLALAAFRLRRRERRALEGQTVWPVARLGFRNAADRPGRSVLVIAVIASATFILISVDAFRREGVPAADRHSGVGGYSLIVELLLPLAYDPNGRDGREALGIEVGNAVSIEPFRVLPGDDVSCLNLYEPRNPRILGAGRRFIDSGRFVFQRSLAQNDAERRNPWLLLDRASPDGVIPVVTDANSMTYVLHRNIGDQITIGQSGRPVRLRIVAALADSIFQGELLMSETNFMRLFPEQEGYRFLLVDAPSGRAAELADAIDRGAADLGATAEATGRRLAEFHTVENAYLSTFQTLGGLGLLLGTVGLGAVLLRNVLERRRELALLGACGYRPGDILTIVIAENVVLLGWGLAIGTVCALVAIVPAVADRGGRVPTMAGGWLLLAAVFVTGILSSTIAMRVALRAPLLMALRSE